MNLPFSPTKKTKTAGLKHDRFNPHLYWRYLLGGVFISLIAIIFYFALFFLETSRVLDAPVTPTANNNLSKIRQMRREVQVIYDSFSGNQQQAQILDQENR